MSRRLPIIIPPKMARPTRSLKLALAALVLAVIVGGGTLVWQNSQRGCCAFPEPVGPRADLGLMTSLPIYWPDGSGLADLAQGNTESPWQRKALEARHALVPLDTLSVIPALSPRQSETDPLAGLDRLAIIQPRGLSPADNVALDGWVRNGGRLLLVLDPMLTGDYDQPLGDPRRPTDTALIPPVVARWGLEVSFDESQAAGRVVRIAGRSVTLQMAGRVREIAGSGAECEFEAAATLATCSIGDGRVTLFADATVFEGVAARDEKITGIQAVLAKAFE